MEYTPNEINNLDYKEALEYDKRSCLIYYLSLLKKGHLFFFCFLNNDDYNSPIIKKFLFFFFFAVHFTVNALFFTDSTMHKIYEDEGDFNFIYQIPQIIYSSLISVVINMSVKLLSLTEKSILELKREKKIEELKEKESGLITKLKIKFTIFFILTFLLLLIFWYYISCFCGIYVNTQAHLIKDSVISFLLSMVYPFGIYLLPCMFRIPALNAPNRDRKCMYTIAKILQFL